MVPKPGYARKFAFFTTRYGGMDMRFQLDGQWLDTPAGIAHYLEHKMFDTADGSAMQGLARGRGEPNAYTSNAVTAYYFDCTEHFYENLRILLSFVSVPYFTDESVEKEQGIIAQEIGMIEDNPEWQVYRQMMQALYRHQPPCGSLWPGPWRASAGSRPRPCTTATRRFIPPANMCLVVVGGVDPEEELRAAREVLPRESGPAIPRDYGRGGGPDASYGPHRGPDGGGHAHLPAGLQVPAGAGGREAHAPGYPWGTWPATCSWESPAPCSPGCTVRG